MGEKVFDGVIWIIQMMKNHWRNKWLRWKQNGIWKWRIFHLSNQVTFDYPLNFWRKFEISAEELVEERAEAEGLGPSELRGSMKFHFLRK